MAAKPPVRAAQRSVVPRSKQVGDFAVDVTLDDFLADRVVPAVKEKEVFAEIKLYDWSCRPVISVHGPDPGRALNVQLEVRSDKGIMLNTKADDHAHLFILEKCKKFHIVVTQLAGGNTSHTPTYGAQPVASSATGGAWNVATNNNENNGKRIQKAGTKTSASSASSKRPPNRNGSTKQHKNAR